MKSLNNFFSNLRRNKQKRRYEERTSASLRGTYLIDENTPFNVVEAFRNLKASISVAIPKKEDGSNDYETVYSLNLELLENCCAMLVRGEKTPMPKYDFLTGLSNPSAYELQLRENEVVLMEGIHALNDDVAGRHPEATKIYISARSNILDGERLVFKGT